MVSLRCKMVVKQELTKLGLHFIVVDLGEIEIMEDINDAQREELRKALLDSGLELMDDKRAVFNRTHYKRYCRNGALFGRITKNKLFRLH